MNDRRNSLVNPAATMAASVSVVTAASSGCSMNGWNSKHSHVLCNLLAEYPSPFIPTAACDLLLDLDESLTVFLGFGLSPDG